MTRCRDSLMKFENPFKLFYSSQFPHLTSPVKEIDEFKYIYVKG